MAAKKKSPKKSPVVETDDGMLPGTPENRERMAEALAQMDPGVARVLEGMDPDRFVALQQFERDCLVLEDEAIYEARERLGLIYISGRDRESFEGLQATIDELQAAIDAAEAKAPARPKDGVDLPARLLSRLRFRERMSDSAGIVAGPPSRPKGEKPGIGSDMNIGTFPDLEDAPGERKTMQFSDEEIAHAKATMLARKRKPKDA